MAPPIQTPTKQLKADLSMILAAAKQDTEVSDPVKRHLGELVAWCEAHLDYSGTMDDRLESSEAALQEIIQGDGEMIDQETAQELIEAMAHSHLLCQATAALIDGPLSAMDEVSKKRFKQLITNAVQGIAFVNQRIAELVADGDDEEEDDGLGDDGIATTDAIDDEEADITDGG